MSGALVKISGKASAAPALGTMMIPVELTGGNAGKLLLSDLKVPLGIEDAVTAHAGGGQGSATALSTTAKIHRISTCTTAADSVIFGAVAAINDWHVVRNAGAASLQIYGSGTDTINDVATATGIAIPPGCSALFASTAANKWWATLLPADFTALNLTFTKAQRGAFVALTDASTVALDLSLANQYRLVLGGNRTLGVPTNIVEGQQGVIAIRQDATGSRTLAYSWPYEWPGGGAGVLSTPGCSRDQLVYSVEKYASSVVTIDIATPGLIHWTAHGLDTGQRFQLTTTGALPTNATANTTFFWITNDANSGWFANTLALAAAGTKVATSGTQSGVHTMVACSISMSLNKAYG
jgi:hypothetical protein